tara:strand:- start:4052 stop:4927 length:876 start_codon:yes stop_codon:yes gene_type:complete
MSRIINGLAYTTRASSTAKLIEIPIEGQTPLAESQALINARSYQLSSRNGANAYILSTDKEDVHLNFIAQKVIVNDADIHTFLEPRFEYFNEEIVPDVDPFVLADGLIFRCVSANSVPKPKEQYTYYIMVNGQSKQIPNYKTLEVMLIERGQNLLSVRVLEGNQCSDIPRDLDTATQITSKANVWKSEYSDTTNLEKFLELENNAQSAGALVAGATATAAGQIAAVQSQAAAANAASVAAAAASSAAQAQAAAAQAEAQAAEAAAQAAQVATELAAAELAAATAALNNGII